MACAEPVLRAVEDFVIDRGHLVRRVESCVQVTDSAGDVSALPKFVPDLIGRDDVGVDDLCQGMGNRRLAGAGATPDDDELHTAGFEVRVRDGEVPLCCRDTVRVSLADTHAVDFGSHDRPVGDAEMP